MIWGGLLQAWLLYDSISQEKWDPKEGRVFSSFEEGRVWAPFAVHQATAPPISSEGIPFPTSELTSAPTPAPSSDHAHARVLQITLIRRGLMVGLWN